MPPALPRHKCRATAQRLAATRHQLVLASTSHVCQAALRQARRTIRMANSVMRSTYDVRMMRRCSRGRQGGGCLGSRQVLEGYQEKLQAAAG